MISIDRMARGDFHRFEIGGEKYVVHHVGKPILVYRAEYLDVGEQNKLLRPTQDEAFAALEWLRSNSTVQGRIVGPFVLCFYDARPSFFGELTGGIRIHRWPYLFAFVRHSAKIEQSNVLVPERPYCGYRERGIDCGGGLLSDPINTCFLYKEATG